MTPSSSEPTATESPEPAAPAAPSMRSPRVYTAALSAFVVAASVWLYATPAARVIGAKVADGVEHSVKQQVRLPKAVAKQPKKQKQKQKQKRATTGKASRATTVSASYERATSKASALTSVAGGDSDAGDSEVGATIGAPVPVPTGTTPTTGGKKIEGCWSFTYQQDAQAYYDAHLDDPLGLDGAKGPDNGDGIACENLPVDPTRSTSVPVGARQVVYPTKAEVSLNANAYFGVAEDGIPGDSSLVNKLGEQVGKAPSMIEWFSNWDETYNVDKVQQAWARGALPVITWMPAHKGNKNPIDTSQQAILSGAWDDYLTAYAQAVAAAKMPVMLRFAHEQNGNWYPWSASQSDLQAKSRGYVNTPAGYIAMWRHVWDIFQAQGANQYAIWAWTPIRVDTLAPGYKGMTALADSYPGDQYVDVVGFSAYAYTSEPWSYDSIFAQTITQLEQVAPTKKILIAETGAAENTGSVSNTDKKAAWIQDTLTQVQEDPHVLGIVWFNNTVVNVHTVNGVSIVTDNKWDSSAKALAAFQQGIAGARFLAGTSADDLSKITAIGDLWKPAVRR